MGSKGSRVKSPKKRPFHGRDERGRRWPQSLEYRRSTAKGQRSSVLPVRARGVGELELELKPGRHGRAQVGQGLEGY